MSQASTPHAWETFSTSPTWSTRPMTECGARSTPLWVHRNLFWQLSRDGNLHGLGMSHATTTSPKPSFRVPWRVGDAVAGRGNVGWTTSKSGQPCPCQNWSEWPPAENCWIVPHVPPTTQSVKELNWAEVNCYRFDVDSFISASGETMRMELVMKDHPQNKTKTHKQKSGTIAEAVLGKKKVSLGGNRIRGIHKDCKRHGF